MSSMVSGVFSRRELSSRGVIVSMERLFLCNWSSISYLRMRDMIGYYLQNICSSEFMRVVMRGSAIVYDTNCQFFSDERIPSSRIFVRNCESWDCQMVQYFSSSQTVLGHSRSLHKIKNLLGWAMSLMRWATSVALFSIGSINYCIVIHEYITNI
jgi:hypothetical protein